MQRTQATILAIAMLAVGFAPTAVAEEECNEPGDGLEVCQEDGEVTSLTLELGEDGAGAVSVTYEDAETWSAQERSAEAEASTAESSPAEENTVIVSVTCTYDDSEVPCTELGGKANAVRDFDRRLLTGFTCTEIGEGSTPACSYGSGSVTLIAGDSGARLTAGCGSLPGFFNPGSDCPRDTNVGTSVYGLLVKAFGSGSADVNLDDPQSSTAGAKVCGSTPPTGFTCAP